MQSVYRPTNLTAYLDSLGARPKKGFSQNFLIDQNIITRILDDACIAPGDVVVEIGPGPGALTDALLARGAHVYAVEKDPLFARGLRERNHPNLHVIEGDFLTLPFPCTEKCKVVANLPYNITTPIFEKLFDNIPHISRITVMVQKEFADRMSATKDSKAYGSLTLFVALYADVFHRFDVSPRCFLPPPKVTSTVITLTPSPKFAGKQYGQLNHLIRHVFTKRRKMLRVCLQGYLTKEEIAALFSQTTICETLRPENLTLPQFAELSSVVQTIQKQ